MRNLKKLLALALVFAMAFTFTAGAADFTDKAEIGANYVDDVNMLVELGVINGYPDGSFGPQKNITRAEFAKMAYTLKYGADINGDLFAAQKSIFTDVEGNANVAWAKGYINYCANQKIVSGVGNNKFNPQGNITVAEATKMILVILGCDPAKEGFTGANWASNVVAKAIELGVFNGWTGDPTALATRELVAKLMKNAVFAPIYTYSAITGAGSQLNALGDAYNQTLGEKTMGLQTVTGIVVANENYAITRDAKNEVIGLTINPTDDEDEAVIYYTIKNENTGALVERTLVIPTGLADELLGNEVSVFFKADETKDNWFTNVELIGNVMVTNDTVVYDVPAASADIYPDGSKRNATGTTSPYISFEVDGVEKVIKAKSDVAKNADYQANAAGLLADFGSLAYYSTANISNENATLVEVDNTTKATSFFADMGTASLSSYRFISVDGGKTYSYIIKMVADNNTNIGYGAVTSYSESKGKIVVTGLGSKDLEDCVINGEIAIDDMVVYYRENGLINIVKPETVTGAVETVNDNGSVVIGGETYYLWQRAYEHSEMNLASDDTLADYFVTNPSAMEDGTTYYVYNNIVLDFAAAEAAEAVVTDYAVIIGSSYDADTNTASVKITTAENVTREYKIGDLYTPVSNEPNNVQNDRPIDFSFNNYFGMVVKYEINEDGTIDLSDNYFKGIVGNTNAANTDAAIRRYENTTYANSALHNIGDMPASADVADGVLTLNNTRKFYAANDASVIFVIYGDPEYVNGKLSATSTTSVEPKATAYKMVDKVLEPMAAIPTMLRPTNVNNSGLTTPVNAHPNFKSISFVENGAKGINSGIVAAAMTIGTDSGNGAASDTTFGAYVVSAYRRYNVSTQKYYLQMTIINADGLQTVKTVDEVKGLKSTDEVEVKVLNNKNTGEIVGDYGAGSFIAYEVNADGDITNVDTKPTVATMGIAADTFYAVNVVGEKNGKLFFYDTDSTVNVKTEQSLQLEFAEDGYDVIGIDDGDYVGETITKISSKKDTLTAADGANAVITLDKEGKIDRIFSFVEPYGGYAAADDSVVVNDEPVAIFGKTAAEYGDYTLTEDDTTNTIKVKGKLNKITGFTAFSSKVEEQTGWYASIQLDFGYASNADPATADFELKLADGRIYGAEALEADGTLILVYWIADENASLKKTFSIDLGDGYEDYTVDFTSVNLLP